MSSSENPGSGKLVPENPYREEPDTGPSSPEKPSPEGLASKTPSHEKPSSKEPSPEETSPEKPSPEEPPRQVGYGKLSTSLSEWCEAQFMGENRGYGVVAIKDIPVGEIVLRDKALIGIDNHDTTSRSAQADINRQYEALPNENRRAFDTLHCYISDKQRAATEKLAWDIMDDDRIRADYMRDYERAQTFATNCFDIGTSVTQAALFLHASRFNHSCLPSCDYDVRLPYSGAGVSKALWHAYAVRDIKKGEEITISYNSRDELREDRQHHLLEIWGFECTCEVCDPSDGDQARADAHEAHLRDLKSDAVWWGRHHYVKKKWDNNEVATHMERLDQRASLCRAVQDDGLLWHTLTRAAKFAAALWLRTCDDQYLDRWKEYLNEARYGLCHRAMDPEENGSWDAETVEDLERGEPDPGGVYTEIEGGSEEDDEDEDDQPAYEWDEA